VKSEQRRGDPKAPQPLAGFFGPHGAALSYFEDTPLAFEWISSRAKAILQSTMKTDQRSVNAAWRHAVEAWLCDAIDENGGLNLYGYVLDDPTSAVDPFGLYSCKEICAEIQKVTDAMETLLDMAKTGKSLKQESASVRGNPFNGADTPLGTAFENQKWLAREDTFLLFEMETLGRAVGDATATTPVNYWSLWAMEEIYRHQQFLDQLNCLAKKQGCKCGSSPK